MLVAGCVSSGRELALPDVAELTGTPFFPQTERDCGPAALATILAAGGVDVSATELLDAVYIEELEGSLQAELLAATRRYGRLPVPVEPDAQALLSEIAAGRPVLVLQNLGLGIAPRWHYAVVVGYDAAEQRFILRSGDERRRRERASRFLRSWRLAEHWGFVAVEPGRVPASATPARYMRALVGADHELATAAIDAAYAAALRHWPDDPEVLFLAGAHAHEAGRSSAAAALYRRTLAHDAGHVAARNNLADVLFEQGCAATALREARQALADTRPDSAFRAAVSDTVNRIEASAQRLSDASGCPASTNAAAH